MRDFRVVAQDKTLALSELNLGLGCLSKGLSFEWV